MKDLTGMNGMSRDVLIITEAGGLETGGREGVTSLLVEMLGCEVEVAGSRKLGLLAVRRREFGVVLVEDSLAESDPDWADQLWAGAGLAMPLRMHLATSGAARLAREIRNALGRRDSEQAMARKVVTAELENELKGSVTGLLLQSELALREAAGSLRLEPKLRSMVELAGELQQRLRGLHA